MDQSYVIAVMVALTIILVIYQYYTAMSMSSFMPIQPQVLPPDTTVTVTNRELALGRILAGY